MLSTYSAQWGEEILPWIALFSGIFVTIIVSLRLQVLRPLAILRAGQVHARALGSTHAE